MSEDVDGNVNETLPRNIGTTFNEFSQHDRKIVRSLESLGKKHTNARYAVTFIDACIRENLLPKFTNLRLHDEAVQQNEHTLSFRRSLLKEEAKKKRRALDDITTRLQEASRTYQQLNIAEDLRQRTDNALQDLLRSHERVVRTRILRKLSTLYGAQVTLPDESDSYINLSAHNLTQDEKDFLNLGFTCRLLSKRNQQEKKAEIELLYQQVCDYHKDGKLEVNPNL